MRSTSFALALFALLACLFVEPLLAQDNQMRVPTAAENPSRCVAARKPIPCEQLVQVHLNARKAMLDHSVANKPCPSDDTEYCAQMTQIHLAQLDESFKATWDLRIQDCEQTRMVDRHCLMKTLKRVRTARGLTRAFRVCYGGRTLLRKWRARADTD